MKVSNAERRGGKEFTVRTRSTSDPSISHIITFPLVTQLAGKQQEPSAIQKAGDGTSEEYILLDLEEGLNPEPGCASSVWKVHQPDVEQVIKS